MTPPPDPAPSAAGDPETDAALQELYQSFPYPPAPPAGDQGSEGAGDTSQMAWDPRNSYPVYFPEERARFDLDILVPGCGTVLAPMMAGLLPEARVVGIDIAPAALAISQEQADRRGLANLTLLELPIEEVASLGRTFDYVHCTGVLHHLRDPVVGLRMLGAVTRPRGALSIMVYAPYGRTGIYMLQELCHLLGMTVDEASALQAQELVARLSDQHPFRLIHPQSGPPISLEELCDMLLNPRDVSFRVADVQKLVEESGMRFHRWLGNAEYLPAFSPLGATALSTVTAGLDPWQQAAAAELCHGTLLKHRFVVTHSSRPPAAELFAGPRLAAAAPSLAAHLKIEEQGANVVLTNEAHQVPIRVQGPTSNLVPLLKPSTAGARSSRSPTNCTAATPPSPSPTASKRTGSSTWPT